MLHPPGEKIERHVTPAALVLEAVVHIDYTNYRGERAARSVVPCKVWHGTTEFHPHAQWLMDAWDVEKRAWRTFAMKDIHSWKEDSHVPDAAREAG